MLFSIFSNNSLKLLQISILTLNYNLIQSVKTLQAVRKKLISAVEFFYFPKNKILYMENHICQSMFFILVGEILVTKLTFNHIDNETIDEPVNLIGELQNF